MAIFKARPGDQNEHGTADRDIMNGGRGNDTLSGLGGNDKLSGGADNDILIGGAGDDLMTGGSGADTFRFTLPTTTVETITFTPSPNDGTIAPSDLTISTLPG